MKTNRKQISRELALRILSTVIVIFVIFSIIMTYIIGRLSLRSQQNDLEQQSKSASYQLETFFNTYTTITGQMSVNSDLEHIMKVTKAGDKITSSPYYSDMYHQLQETQATDKNILAAWIGDIDANVLTQSDGYTSDDTFDITQRQWYEVTKTGESMLTDVYTDASTGDLILSAASPMYDDETGNVLGVAGLDISLDHISTLFSEYKVGDTGFVILLESDGTIIYHPNSNYMLKSIGDIGGGDFITNADADEDSTMKFTLEGVNYYGYFNNITDTDYFVLSCLPAGEYFEDLKECIIFIIVLIILGLGAIVVSIKRVAAAITKPIVSLNSVAQELAAGNLDVTMNIDSDNEIGALADSIQLTVNRLKEYINYINEITYALNRLADGKLKFKLKYDYSGDFAKVKDALINISDSMQSIMADITDGSNQVLMGSEELARAAQSIAENASTQSASVEELVATTSTVAQQVHDNTAEAKNAASETERVTQMMRQSKEQMTRMTDAMEKISETSNQVVGIIKTIEDIADQTNLLALNASIEAARAGDVGKGFAVVASEIGSLADGSAKAANTTRDLIGVSINEIEVGSKLVTEVVDSIQQVMDAVQKVNVMISKSAETYVFQEQSINQIEIGIEEISKAVEENSAVSEETSATSEELAAQAANLEQLVERFDLVNEE